MKNSFLSLPEVTNLCKIVWGSDSKIAADFYTQPYAEEFTQFSGFQAGRLSDDQYFVQQLVRFGYLVPSDLDTQALPDLVTQAPLYATHTDYLERLQHSLARASALTLELAPLVAYGEALANELLAQSTNLQAHKKASTNKAANLDKHTLQNTALTNSQQLSTNAWGQTIITASDAASDLVDIASLLSDKTQATLGTKGLLRLRLFWQGTKAQAAQLQGKFTLKQINAAVTQRLIYQYIAQNSQLQEQEWVMVVNEELKLLPDWRLRVEQYLQLVTILQQSLANNAELQALRVKANTANPASSRVDISFANTDSELASATKDTDANTNATQSTVQSTEQIVAQSTAKSSAQSSEQENFVAYKQTYRQALLQAYSELPEYLQTALARGEHALVALLDRLVRTGLIKLGNQLYQAKDLTLANWVNVDNPHKHPSNLVSIAAHQVHLNLSTSPSAYPQVAEQDIHLGLEFLQALQGTGAAGFLVSKRALLQNHIASTTSISLDQAGFTTSQAHSKILQKLGWQPCVPQGRYSLLAGAFSNWQQGQTVVANAIPSLGMLLAQEQPAVANAWATISQALYDVNYQKGTLSTGYDYLATMRKYVLAPAAAHSSHLDALGFITPAASISYTTLGNSATSQEVLGNFFAQENTVDFQLCNTLALNHSTNLQEATSKLDLAALLQDLSLSNLQTLAQQVNADQSILAYDYLLLVPRTACFSADWYKQANQALTQAFVRAGEVPIFIILPVNSTNTSSTTSSTNTNETSATSTTDNVTSSDISLTNEQVSTATLASLGGIIVAKRALPKIVQQLAAGETVAALAINGIVTHLAPLALDVEAQQTSLLAYELMQQSLNSSVALHDLELSEKQFAQLAKDLQLSLAELTSTLSCEPQVVTAKQVNSSTTAEAEATAESNSHSVSDGDTSANSDTTVSTDATANAETTTAAVRISQAQSKTKGGFFRNLFKGSKKEPKAELKAESKANASNEDKVTNNHQAYSEQVNKQQETSASKSSLVANSANEQATVYQYQLDLRKLADLIVAKQLS
ncbi:hypothetical protein [Psittacicella hinzii]|uniref:Uncharacterized protein n=1 Tax=Psittacicella hinzii TaxID=2028575 RepID=A0A3A1YS32_9GAMM|nr:hypothetical protein [Psittacicella hinzii]RIY40018.1 hypothetical protein CKF58_01245 [Psittacicella hinzii]